MAEWHGVEKTLANLASDDHDEFGSFYLGEVSVPKYSNIQENSNENGTADRIKERRRALQMTQKELSERTGLARAYLSQLEHGRRQGSVTALQKIAAVLQMKISELL